jgi:thymidylate synthase
MYQAKNNVSAWAKLKFLCETKGHRQDIERGSFEDGNFYRLQLPPVAMQINNPLEFETLPKEVTIGMIMDYYRLYIMWAGEKSHNEQYTYAERISKQLPVVLEMLANTPATNQAAMAISEPGDINLEHPPCLREISFSVIGQHLHVSTFWRSNDIGEAFLINQGGISLLLKDAAEYSGLKVGDHFYFCTNPHIYVKSKIVQPPFD